MARLRSDFNLEIWTPSTESYCLFSTDCLTHSRYAGTWISDWYSTICHLSFEFSSPAFTWLSVYRDLVRNPNQLWRLNRTDDPQPRSLRRVSYSSCEPSSGRLKLNGHSLSEEYLGLIRSKRGAVNPVESARGAFPFFAWKNIWAAVIGEFTGRSRRICQNLSTGRIIPLFPPMTKLSAPKITYS